MTHLGYDIESPVWRHWVRDLSLQPHASSATTNAAAAYRIGSATDFTLRRLGQPISSPWWKRLDWNAFRCSACRRAARWRWPTPPGIPSGSAKLVLCSAYARGRAVRAVSEEEKRAAALDLDLARVGWGRDDPAFRQVFAAQFLPDGTRADWAAFDQLQRRTTSPENAVRFLEEFARIDVRDEAQQVACPTLIMHSRDDHRVPHALRRGTGRADSRIRDWSRWPATTIC